MKVPLTIADHLDRAEAVYGRRTVLLDEPDQPAAPWGAAHGLRPWRSAPGPRPPRLDDLGVAHGERVAIVSQNSARLLTAFWGVSGYGRMLVPINFRLGADEIRYIVDHSGASMLLVDPELDDARGQLDVTHRLVLGAESDEELYRYGVEPRAVGCRRGRDRDHQLHERHHGASEGRAAHAPQPLGQLGHVRAGTWA